MLKKKMDLAIVNRGFWEDDSNKVIGEALTDFAETASEKYQTCVIAQSKGKLKERLLKAGRCEHVRLFLFKHFTSSKSAFAFRSLDAALFALFVFFSLVRARPRRIYISTDPPVVVPFIVGLYSFLFRAEYYYHMQDIHPEASGLVVELPRIAYRMMKWMDAQTVRGARKIITLSEEMASYISTGRGYRGEVKLLENPSGYLCLEKVPKVRGFVFCGNIGRLQRIPLLIESVEKYRKLGGKAEFTFIGSGANADLIRQLSERISGVDYLGPLHPDQASTVIGSHKWALLPIEDSVTHFAFPSKSSTYLLSGCGILAVCGEQTSVANWVKQHNYGLVCQPEVDALVDMFSSLQDQVFQNSKEGVSGSIREKYSYAKFSSSLIDIVFSQE